MIHQRKAPYIWTPISLAGGILFSIVDWRVHAAVWFIMAGVWGSNILEDVIEWKIEREFRNRPTIERERIYRNVDLHVTTLEPVDMTFEDFEKDSK